jgi:hypothetical protein
MKSYNIYSVKYIRCGHFTKRKETATGRQRGLRIRVRRLLCEARHRELPVAVMPDTEREELRSSFQFKSEQKEAEIQAEREEQRKREEEAGISRRSSKDGYGYGNWYS